MATPASGAGDFCFVHAADLHLDTPFKGIGEVAPAVAEALREASLQAFDELIELCLTRRAAFLVVAGDVYDGAERGIRAQLRFRDGLARLSEAGIAAFVVHGNHDPVESGWTAVGAWPPLVTVFGSEVVGSVPVVREGRQIAVVHGISYGRREVRENLALRFSRGEAEGGGLQVGLLHCNVGAAEGHEDYSPCTLDDLHGARLDYWALGHVHSRLVLSGRPYGDEPWVVYAGNLQARSPKPSERGAKGAVVVQVRDGRVAEVEFVACDRIRYGSVEVDLEGLSSIAALRDALAEAALEEVAAAGGRSIILRARLTGPSELHAALHSEGALAELRASLREEARLARPWCWWDRIDDASAPVVDLEELRAGSDFTADLIALADEVALACAPPGLAPGLETELPGELLSEITSTLPKGLRARALACGVEAGPLISAALRTAVDELGAGDPLAEANR